MPKGLCYDRVAAKPGILLQLLGSKRRGRPDRLELVSQSVTERFRVFVRSSLRKRRRERVDTGARMSGFTPCTLARGKDGSVEEYFAKTSGHGYNDMISLPTLTKESIIENLSRRFKVCLTTNAHISILQGK